MPNHIISLVVYHYEVMVSIGENNNQFANSIKKYASPEILEDLKDDSSIFDLQKHALGSTWHYHKTGVTIIRIPKKPKTVREYGTLNHEIFHAVDFIFARIGIKLVPESAEAYAYAIGYLTEQIYSRFKLK